MKKKGLLAALLVMGIGFAAVSTTLYINGTSKINTNDDDFKVYYSDAKVNGTQDLSVVVDETHLSFSTTLDTLGQSYVLDYDVTNGSKNYNADLEMTCTGGNEYLTVSNEFDDESILEALDTRSGKLTLELTKSYTGDDLDVNIDCNINANAVERNVLGEGTAANPVEPLTWIYTDSDADGAISVGDVYTLNVNRNETFNVISQTEDTVTMLAQKNLGPDYKQSDSFNYITFSNSNGWENTPGPKEIDIQSYEGNAKTYVNEYILYLQTETGDTTISGNLITLAELRTLGCTINDDYSFTSELTCENSKYTNWLINGQYWWTRSANTVHNIYVWFMYPYGDLFISSYQSAYGIRPTITISKTDLIK